MLIKAYQVEVFQNGRCHTLFKRYSEFEEMHKQVKKVMSTPEFPPKKVLKWQPKVIEQRREILEQYLQGILESDSIPRTFFKFLEVQLARTGSFDSLDVGLTETTVTHQPMVGFIKEAFLQDSHRSILPDIVSLGIYDGLYNRHYDDLIAKTLTVCFKLEQVFTIKRRTYTTRTGDPQSIFNKELSLKPSIGNRMQCSS